MKKGNAINDPIVFGLIFFVVIIFFGIFLLTARNLEEHMQDDVSEEKIASFDGNLAVQAYLQTPLSVDATRYLNGTVVTEYEGSIADSLPRVLADCVADDNEFCKAFRTRSMLFAQSICHYDYVITIAGEGALRISPHGPRTFQSSNTVSGFGGRWVDSEDFSRKGVLLAGEQSIPTTTGVITTRIACLARHGVDV